MLTLFRFVTSYLNIFFLDELVDFIDHLSYCNMYCCLLVVSLVELDIDAFVQSLFCFLLYISVFPYNQYTFSLLKRHSFLNLSLG